MHLFDDVLCAYGTTTNNLAGEFEADIAIDGTGRKAAEAATKFLPTCLTVTPPLRSQATVSFASHRDQRSLPLHRSFKYM